MTSLAEADEAHLRKPLDEPRNGRIGTLRSDEPCHQVRLLVIASGVISSRRVRNAMSSATHPSTAWQSDSRVIVMSTPCHPGSAITRRSATGAESMAARKLASGSAKIASGGRSRARATAPRRRRAQRARTPRPSCRPDGGASDQRGPVPGLVVSGDMWPESRLNRLPVKEHRPGITARRSRLIARRAC